MSGRRDDIGRLHSIIAANGSIEYIDVAFRLADHFPSIKAIFRATRKELLEVPGVNEVMADRIHAIRGLSEGGLLPGPGLHDPPGVPPC